MTEWNLILLNRDEKCEGEYTWERNHILKSATDFVLVNELMYNKFRNMRIDEEKSICDLSDHNLIGTQFDTERCERYEKGGWISSKYYKTDKESLINFIKAIERYLEKNPTNDITNSKKRLKKQHTEYWQQYTEEGKTGRKKLQYNNHG